MKNTNDMILTLLIWLLIGLIQILIWVLPTWNPIPTEFATWLSSAFAYLRGFNWFFPVDQLFAALLVSFSVDLILLSWWSFRWIMRHLPFWKH